MGMQNSRRPCSTRQPTPAYAPKWRAMPSPAPAPPPRRSAEGVPPPPRRHRHIAGFHTLSIRGRRPRFEVSMFGGKGGLRGCECGYGLLAATSRRVPLVSNLTHLPARNVVGGQIVLNSSSTIYQLAKHGRLS